MKLLLIFSIVFLSSCSSLKDWTKDIMEPKTDMDEVHEAHRPLEKQRLIPRQGYEGRLTNRICTKWYGDKCESESTREYSLKDKATRKRLIGLNFACHVGDKRYRICPDKEGLCRREKKTYCSKWVRKHIFTNKKKCKKWKVKGINKFIPITDYQFLLDSRTECKKGF